MASFNQKEVTFWLIEQAVTKEKQSIRKVNFKVMCKMTSGKIVEEDETDREYRIQRNRVRKL